MSLDHIFKNMLVVNRVKDKAPKPTLIDNIGQAMGAQKQRTLGRQEISTRHYNYELLMQDLGVKTYARKVQERREQEEKQATGSHERLASDQDSALMHVESDVNSILEDQTPNERQANKKKGHKIAYEFTQSEIVSLIQVWHVFNCFRSEILT